jgi:hypothetical protein
LVRWSAFFGMLPIFFMNDRWNNQKGQHKTFCSSSLPQIF